MYLGPKPNILAADVLGGERHFWQGEKWWRRRELNPDQPVLIISQ
jgi:hypothetical protein